jgi:group I intron endonuclease
MTSGIYLITNKINGHKYVGGSINIEDRFGKHKRFQDLKTSAVDRAIKKYGNENFTYQIITELPADWNIIGKHEKYWIKFYNTFKDKQHYNLTKGGEGMSGWKPSLETRQKISDSKTGKTPSEETKKKMSDAHKGENHINYGKTGKDTTAWKNYARIIKHGFSRGKQRYSIEFNGKTIKRSINKKFLKQWFNENYPDEELVSND